MKLLQRPNHKIPQALLLIGWVVMLCGLFYLPSRNAFKNAVYLLFIIPSLFFVYQYFRQEKNRINVPFGIFLSVLTWLVLSSLWSTDHDFFSALKRAINIGVTPISFYYLTKSKERFYLSTLIAVTTVSLFLVYWTANAFFLNKNLIIFFRTEFLSHVDSMYNILMFGHVLSFLAALMLAFSLSLKGNIRIVSLCNLSILLLAVFLLQQRTPIAALFCCGSAAVLFNLKHLKNKYILVAAAALIAVIFMNQQYLISIFSKDIVRVTIWQEAFQMSLESPIWGHGWDTDLLINITNRAGEAETWYDAHNLFLQMFFYGGAVGVVTLITLYAACFVFAVKQKSPFTLVLITFSFFAIQTDGMGLLSKPKEEWFNVWLPLALVISQSLLRFNSKETYQSDTLTH